MSQSISRRSFLKCAGSGAVSLAAALLTGVSAAAAELRAAGDPALLDGKAAVELLGYAPAPGLGGVLDGKAAVELLGYAPAPELGGVLVYLSVENLSTASLPVDTSYLQSRGLRTREQLYSMGTGVTAACNGQSVPCGSFAAPLYSENAADASVFTLNLAAGRGALLHCFCAVPEDWQTLALTPGAAPSLRCAAMPTKPLWAPCPPPPPRSAAWWTCNSIVKEPLHKLPCNGSFYVYAPTSASPVLFCTSSSCPVRLESRAM